MTTVFYRVGSESIDGGEAYRDGEAMTSSPDLSQRIAHELGPQHLVHMAIGDEHIGAGTWVSGANVLIVSRASHVVVWDNQAIDLGQFKEGFSVTHETVVTGAGDYLTSYYPFILGGVAHTWDRSIQFAVGSTSPASTEDVPPALREALDAIRDIRNVALEEGCDEPSQMAMTNAEVVLRFMYDLSPQVYDVYPMGGGEIAIDGGNRGRRIGVFCYPDGRVQCVGWVGNKRQEVRQDNAESIPVDFLRQALSHLES